MCNNMLLHHDYIRADEHFDNKKKGMPSRGLWMTGQDYLEKKKVSRFSTCEGLVKKHTNKYFSDVKTFSHHAFHYTMPLFPWIRLIPIFPYL